MIIYVYIIIQLYNLIAILFFVKNKANITFLIIFNHSSDYFFIYTDIYYTGERKHTYIFNT